MTGQEIDRISRLIAQLRRERIRLDWSLAKYPRCKEADSWRTRLKEIDAQICELQSDYSNLW